MKLAVITDTTAVLSDDLKAKENLFVLDIPIMIGGVSYVEGKDLSLDDFYKKMAMSPTLPKTSQPSLVKLDEIFTTFIRRLHTRCGIVLVIRHFRILAEYPVLN